jgi:hypothetical protein
MNLFVSDELADGV